MGFKFCIFAFAFQVFLLKAMTDDTMTTEKQKTSCVRAHIRTREKFIDLSVFTVYLYRNHKLYIKQVKVLYLRGINYIHSTRKLYTFLKHFS